MSLPTPTLLADVFVACRQRRFTPKLSDSLGARLTGGDVLARAVGLRQVLRRALPGAADVPVAVLLPPSVPAAVVNLALAFDRRITINLNYTLTAEQLNAQLADAGVRQIITSRRFLAKLPLALNAGMVMLEDLAPQATRRDKLLAAVLAYAAPLPLVWRWLGLHQAREDDVMTIVFTSGSTDRPKGVQLSFGNLEASVEAVDSVLQLDPHDVLIGVLPFFHSFGSTITLWAALAKNIGAAYHTNPLDAQVVGRLCREEKGTILPVTPMFLRSYAQRTEPADFKTLEIVATGGEALPPAVAAGFEQRFGLRPFEAYGVTEMSPLISSNAPPARAAKGASATLREGTVGKPVAGVRAKVVDPQTGQELGAGERGLLLVTGPNVMRGYLNEPAATAAVMREGWYVTGDIAVIDEDGFITLVDRLSRFAKIAGEMVPFVTVERALAEIIGLAEDGGPRAVVTAVPDPTRGERLVVVHTALPRTPAELRDALAAQGLPNLFLPGRDSFVEVEVLPVVGSGKLDLKGIKQIALQAMTERGAKRPASEAVA